MSTQNKKLKYFWSFWNWKTEPERSVGFGWKKLKNRTRAFGWFRFRKILKNRTRTFGWFRFRKILKNRTRTFGWFRFLKILKNRTRTFWRFRFWKIFKKPRSLDMQYEKNFLHKEKQILHKKYTTQKNYLWSNERVRWLNRTRTFGWFRFLRLRLRGSVRYWLWFHHS